MNNLLGNEEAENGVNPNSEDLDAEEDDGSVNTPNVMTQPQSDIKEATRAVGVESEWFRAIFDSLTFCD